nr:TetR family transcriptional regulator [Anoxynatronum buryatiense]
MKAAIKVLSEKGLEKTKVSDVVQEAGVAQGTFYLYYQSKNALIPAIADNMLQYMLNQMKTHISPQDTFFDQMEKIVGITFETTHLYREVLGLCYSGMAVTGAFLEWEEIYKPYYHWLEERIAAAQLKGEIRRDMRVDMIAKIVVEMMEGVAEQVYLFEESSSNALIYQQELMAFVKRALTP